MWDGWTNSNHSTYRVAIILFVALLHRPHCILRSFFISISSQDWFQPNICPPELMFVQSNSLIFLSVPCRTYETHSTLYVDICHERTTIMNDERALWLVCRGTWVPPKSKRLTVNSLGTKVCCSYECDCTVPSETHGLRTQCRPIADMKKSFTIVL